MERKIYYYIVAFGLTAIFLYSLMTMFLRNINLPIIPTEGLKVLFALFIIIYETTSANKVSKAIIFSMLPLTIIGYMFRIMHWPFGLLMFLGSLLVILTALFVNAFKSVNQRFEKTAILIYPLSHLIFLTTSIYRLPPVWYIIDVFIIGLTVVFLWTLLLRVRKYN